MASAGVTAEETAFVGDDVLDLLGMRAVGLSIAVAGDVAMAERLPITDAMTAQDLHDALAPLGADLMVRAMGGLLRGGLQVTKQSEQGVTYAAKIDNSRFPCHADQWIPLYVGDRHVRPSRGHEKGPQGLFQVP